MDTNMFLQFCIGLAVIMTGLTLFFTFRPLKPGEKSGERLPVLLTSELLLTMSAAWLLVYASNTPNSLKDVSVFVSCVLLAIGLGMFFRDGGRLLLNKHKDS